jgi:protein tyrosine/serine phosphatase
MMITDRVAGMGDRTITFGNVFNFRDLGGYRTADGRTVRWGRLFRADDLCRLDEDDLARLGELGVRTVIDLRRPAEVTRRGRIPPAGYTYLHAHIVHNDWPVTEFPTPRARVDYLVERYLDLAELGGEGIALALRTIADPAALPAVFHCLAGKDRTGLIAAFTLHLLGVREDDIADDFALSELAEEANWNWWGAKYPDTHMDTGPRRWEQYTVTPREAMIEFLAALRQRHGSVEKYLESIGVGPDTAEALRAQLLE